jgi:hypothetical protein
MNPSPGQIERAVLTLATGPRIYWQMAVNLARSIRHWHPDGSLPVFIATDSEGKVPSDLLNVSILKLRPGELGGGFRPKLHLDRLAPARQTLFIDADCLVYASLDPVFRQFSGQPVGVLAGRISGGEWFGDVARYCRELGVVALPKFNGGLYYLEPATAGPVYTEARTLGERYDELGLVRLRGSPNDELVMAGAMARHNLWGVPDDGSIMGDFQACPGPYRLDVLQGRRRLTNPPAGHPLHCTWSPFREIEPSIVHFLGHHTQLPAYRSEAAALDWAARGLPAILSRLAARALIRIPGECLGFAKHNLRPLYRRLFGVRSIAASDRMSSS